MVTLFGLVPHGKNLGVSVARIKSKLSGMAEISEIRVRAWSAEIALKGKLPYTSMTVTQWRTRVLSLITGRKTSVIVD